MVTSLFIRKKNDKYVVICEYRDKETKKKKQKQMAAFVRKKDATVFLSEKKIELGHGYFVTPTSTNFNNYLNTWNDLRKDTIAIATYDYYKSMIRCHYSTDTKIGSANLQEVTPLMLNQFFKSLRAAGLAENTVAKHYKFLHKAFEDAIRNQMVQKKPTDYSEKVQAKKSDISTCLTKNEAQELVRLSIDTRYELPINFALGLGLRSGECFGLRWSDIDFESNTIKIRQTITQDKSTREIFFKEPKTTSSKRTLIIPDALALMLKRHKLKQKQNKYDLIFINTKEMPILPCDFSSNFSKFIKNNGLRHIRFHDLRHTNASLHLLAGTDLKVTSKNLGHSTIGITADLYTHVLEELDQNAANAINDVLYENL